MSLTSSRTSHASKPNEIIELLELFLRSRWAEINTVPIVELHATNSELHDNTPEEKKKWKEHFHQWVETVDITGQVL
jgi:hypothetical protein